MRRDRHPVVVVIEQAAAFAPKQREGALSTPERIAPSQQRSGGTEVWSDSRSREFQA